MSCPPPTCPSPLSVIPLPRPGPVIVASLAPFASADVVTNAARRATAAENSARRFMVKPPAIDVGSHTPRLWERFHLARDRWNSTVLGLRKSLAPASLLA